MPRMWNNPLELIKVLVTLAPELNVRVALYELVEFIDNLDDESVVDAADLLEVICQTLDALHHHVGEEDEEHEEGDKEDFTGLDIEDIVGRFRNQLNSDKEKDK